MVCYGTGYYCKCCVMWYALLHCRRVVCSFMVCDMLWYSALCGMAWDGLHYEIVICYAMLCYAVR